MPNKIRRSINYLNEKTIKILNEIIEFLDITRLLIEIVGLVLIYLVFASGNLLTSDRSNKKNKSDSNFWKL